MASIGAATVGSVYGPTDTVLFSVAPSGQAWTYEVWDRMTGTVVKTGPANQATVVITPPSGGRWRTQQYEVVIPQAGVSCNFTVADLADDRFPALPSTNLPYAGQSHIQKLSPHVLGFGGAGYARLSIEAIDDKAPPWGSNVQVDGGQLLGVKAHLDTYWADYADPTQPREYMVSIATNGWAADRLAVYRASDGPYARPAGIFYPVDPSDGAHLFVTVTNGTSTGRKVVVDRDGAAVATYDNLATGGAIETALAADGRVKFFGRGPNEPDLPDTKTRTAIGNTCWLAVRALTVQMFDGGVTRIELPWNEGQGWRPQVVGQEILAARAAVKSVRTGMKVCGPCLVGLNNTEVGESHFLEQLLAYIGPGILDEITTHLYNSGEVLDLQLYYKCLFTAAAQFAAAGYGGLKWWMSELPVTHWWYGVFREHSSVVTYLMQQLLWAQFAGPGALTRWFKWPHKDDFWAGALVNGNNTLSPLVPVSRWLTEATRGRPNGARVDMGTEGNRRWAATRFTGDSGAGQCLALLDVSGGGANAVKLTVSGTGTATIDHANVTRTATVTSGAGQLLVSDWSGNPLPPLTVTAGATVVTTTPAAFVEVPPGVTVNVVPVSLGTDILEGASVTVSGGTAWANVPASRITEDRLFSNLWLDATAEENHLYAQGGFAPWRSETSTKPQTVTVTDGQLVNGVTVVEVDCPAPWGQDGAILLGFTIDVSADGTTWTQVFAQDTDPADFYALRELTGSQWAQGAGGDPNRRARAIVWHPDTHHWLIPLPPGTNARYYRETITRSSAMGALNEELRALSNGNIGAPNDQRPVQRRMRAFTGDASALVAAATAPTTPPPTTGPVTGSGRYVVKAGTLSP